MEKLNDGWSFARHAPEAFAPVTLPHDWLIADAHHLYESGDGFYRRALDTSALAEGQRVFLRFDGVYMDCVLFVNGAQAGEWKYGFTAFELDITDFLRPDGHNELLMQVRYRAPSARWYTGAGIYRDVWLKVKNACHFVSDGIYVSTHKDGGTWRYTATAEVETGGQPYAVRHTLLDAEDEIAPWELDAPRLYTLRSELMVDDRVMDVEDTRFGFRTIDFSPDEGFFLNGRHVKLYGVCLHHDLGALGAAVYPDAIRRQLTLLRQMGVNALRTAHNPPAKVFMEIADEMGFVVMSEIFDTWRLPKNTYDYARFFDAWHERDVASWVRRDRNHPSVIMWSVGNEIYDTHADAEAGGETLRRLAELVERHDPDGHARVTLCSNYMPWPNTQQCADLVKLVGYNYAEGLYAEHHAEHPDWMIYGGETCATVQSRGVYHFPLSQSVLADDDLQCSALGNSVTSWGAKSVEACILADLNTPFSLGQFVWAGQDYLGEPTPYHTKNCYFGQMDTAGFPKDSYYLFQAAWTDPRKAPMVHLFPFWDFSPGQMIDVRVCSNAEEAELFRDEESLGRVRLEGRIVADWRVPYRPGTLRAVAYDADGAPVAQAVRQSFGDVDRLHLERQTVGELTFVEISAVDREGRPVENANCRVQVHVKGGRLLGLDNGDSTDYDSYQSDSRRLFGGKLLAVVRAEEGVPPEVTATVDRGDIPVRKIVLSADGYDVIAQTFPEGATYTDLHWRLTDAAGIDSPLGALRVSPDGRRATVLPKGDGVVYVRCSPTNGRGHMAFISQISLTIEGVGKPLLNPYAFLSAGLYTDSNVALTNGNERGVATLRDGESHIGFRNVDFGEYGSDEVVLPLFPLLREPFLFEIWEGMPLEGGEKLCDVRYDKETAWNTYREITCRLPRRLRGVTTFCLVFRQKVHVKGFQFTRYDKAYERLAASQYDRAYGDSFQVAGGAVERIGNNVTLIFDHMDFGEAGASRLALSWRSRLARNSVQVIFTSDDVERRHMIEIPASGAYAEAEFPLGEAIRGTQTVSLLFLPGTDMDLAWLRFLK